MDNYIYVLHERGAKSHFLALEEYALRHDKKIAYHEFSITRFLFKSIVKRDFNLLKNQLLNIVFLIKLCFSSKKKIIIGIAPYDWRLVHLKLILKKHNVFYFTSWTSWSGDFYPKKKLSSFNYIKKSWRGFLEKDVKGVFAVTNSALSSLKEYYDLKCKSSIVYHAYSQKSLINTAVNERESNKTKLIYVGRLIEEKGIQELFDLMNVLDPQKFSLTIIGDGELKSIVETKAQLQSNINYIGYLSDKKELYKTYQNHDIQILFSRKSDTWEELFGIVIIEAMLNGVITLTTDHSGPKEIIKNNVDGFILSDDSKLVKNTKAILDEGIKDLNQMKQEALMNSQYFSVDKLYLKWKDLLDE